ncbi:MAG: NAD(P)-dependent glycerol-3-phosphate dehydrogenase [bacterium]|jgi:glycerol-3-phosphate dehydrogenase (NAD(P)+)
MAEQRKIAVIGGGSWGTAFAWLQGTKGVPVTVWAREPEVVEGINTFKRNPFFCKGALLPTCVCATGDLAEALDGAWLGVAAVPSKFLPGMVDELRPVWPDGTAYLSLTKGLCGEPPGFANEYFARNWPELGSARFAVLSGPNLADEVAAGKPAAAVVASESAELALKIQGAVSAPTYRVYTSSDVTGVEVGGSVKNIIAIAAGIVEGLGLGINARSVLITRGLVEMSRFARSLGARPETLMGLSGLGDLITTCSGPKSRNFGFGMRLAAGESADAIVESMRMVAEGVTTARAIRERAASMGVEMPIAEQVCRILDGAATPADAISALMGRELKAE